MDPQTKQPTHQSPETATQRFLTGIWQEVLLLEEIGLDDDFFELGGDSLLALHVYGKIRKRYGREFPMFNLSEPSTIRNLARLIDLNLSDKEPGVFRSLRQVQQGDDGVVPLFLVHGGDGNARVFQRLAVNLDPRIPVYSFRWPGWDGRRGPTAFRAMAQSYVEEILRFHSVGPCRIGGYCIGGLVALEIARLLGEAGREVQGSVYIWDAPNVESGSYHTKEPWYSSGDYVVFKRMVGQLNALKRESKGECEPLTVPTEFTGSYELLRRFPKLYTLARTMQILMANAPIQLCLLTGKPVPIKQRWVYGMSTCYFALQRHATKKYTGSIIYFRSDVFLGRTMNMLGWWEDPFLGFGELCEGEFKGYVVGGNHVDVLAEPLGAQIVNQTYFSQV